jgi:ABC-type nitrate/sulfonate/bicarbonate transport system substrate-binding protein
VLPVPPSQAVGNLAPEDVTVLPVPPSQAVGNLAPEGLWCGQ